MSLPTRTRQRRKSPSREEKPGYAEGLDKLQQEAVVHLSPLPAQQPRPASSQSITGPITGERPCSRELSVMGTDESQSQSTPPLANHHQQLRISTNIVSPSTRMDTPQVPFQSNLKILSHICLNFLLLGSQKTGTAPALTMMRKIAMQKSPPLQDSGCHHKQLLWLCHQQDQSQHLPRWITLPRVIQIKWHHKTTISITKTIQPCQFNTLIIISFQTGSDRHIHDIQDKTFHRGILENGHNAYLMELPGLKSLLRTSRYLMDEVTGQFYAVFGNSCLCICTIPRLTHT